MRILVLHPGALGDLILGLPVLATLRKRHPYARIFGFVRFPVWRYTSLDIQTQYLESSGIHRLFSTPDAGVTGAAELVVSWMGASDRDFVDNLAEATGGKVFAVSPNPPEGGVIHVSQYLLNKLGLSSGAAVPTWTDAPATLKASSKDDEAADKALNGLDIESIPSLLVIHPGSGAPAKRWPAPRFADVAGRWRSAGGSVLLLEGPADRERVSAIAGQGKMAVLRDAPLGVLISILSRCASYLGNDSGITHLAAGAGAATVALFGPTDPRVWGPVGPRVKIIYSAADCSPCERSSWSQCREGGCMDGIDAEQVWGELFSIQRG